MSSGNKGAKRQRKKQGRREKIEQEIRELKAKKRRRALTNLLVLGVIAGSIAYFTLRPDGENASAKGPDCKVETEAAAKPVDPPRNPTVADTKKKYTATVETSEGVVEMSLANETSPCTVNSFVHLAKEGFYDGLSIHRIVKDFAIQGGAVNEDGTGGPGYKVQDDPPKDFKYVKGTVAMAKNGADPAGTAGSQFFFVPGDGALELPGDYGVLGKVISGEDAIGKLNAIETKPSSNGENSTPTRAVSIVKITIKEG